jgi:hypothetical protein
MDEQRRASIVSALHQYRETVSQHNFFILRLLVEGMESKPLPPNLTPNVALHLYMNEFNRFLQGQIPNDVQTPGDLLNDDVRTELVRIGSLDGVQHGAVDLQEREEFFAAIQTRIAEMNVQVEEFPPVDLGYLCTLVCAITGPGLPYNRELEQFDFISSFLIVGIEEMVDKVIVPIRHDDGETGNALTYVWEDWEIAIAVKIGGGGPREWGGSYALYCRNEGNKQWKWRYGIHDEEWGSDVYDSVEAFLDFYAHFREQTEEEARSEISNVPKSFGI